MITDLYDVELFGIIAVSLAVSVMAFKRARILPRHMVVQKVIRYAKALIFVAWATLFLWLLFGFPIGDAAWFARTFVGPGIFATFCLTLMALIEC